MIRYYIDVETTGLDHTIHEIISIAIIAENSKTGNILGEFDRKIKPMSIGSAEPKALEINGYNLEGWKDAVEPSLDIAETIAGLLDHEDCGLWVGHNPYFDKRFIDAFLRKYGDGSKLDYMPMLDTRQVAMALFWPELRRFSLQNVRAHMGLGRSQIHQARSDAFICREIVHRFDIRAKSG